MYNIALRVSENKRPFPLLGDVLFYRNKKGQAYLAPAEGDHSRAKKAD